MCLSTVYELGAGRTPKKLCEYVCTVSVSGDTISFTDITGNETVFAGIIKEIDLTKNTIHVSKGGAQGEAYPNPPSFRLA
jgi:predicted RNA-binding protein